MSRPLAVKSLLIALLIAVAIVAPLFTATTPIHAAQDDAAATRVLGLVNQYRIDSGFWPLRVHPALQAMAEAQAAYIFPNRANIGDEGSYHKDAQGRDARTRARDVYKWPAYGRPDRVEAGENAAEFPVERAFQFWQESGIHRAAALSVAFREVGIAAIPLPNRPNSYLFYMTFGGRPNVLPVLFDPNNRWLYLSADRSRYGTNKDWKDVQVQLLDARRNPIGDQVNWSRTLILPPDINVEDTIYVQFKGPGVDVTTAVDLQGDVAILPSTLSLMTAAQQSKVVGDAELQPTATPAVVVVNASPTPTPTTQQQNTNATNTPRAAVSTATPTITPTTEAVVATATTAAPTARPAGAADLTITYTSSGLVVRNSANRVLDLSTLQVGTTTMQQWLRVAQFPAEAFPANHCMQVLGRGVVQGPRVPECRFMRSEVQATNAYWTAGSFDVLYNGEIIQICEAAAGKCEVDLP